MKEQGNTLPKHLEDLTFALDPRETVTNMEGHCRHGNIATLFATTRFGGIICNATPACKEVADCGKLADKRNRALATKMLTRGTLQVLNPVADAR